MSGRRRGDSPSRPRPPGSEGESLRRSPAGLGEDPLSADAFLAEAFYRAPPARSSPDPVPGGPHAAPLRDKPTHYKVVSISLYLEDLARLEAMVEELKRRGHTKANRSQLIRFALDTVNLDEMPRSY